MSPISQRIPRKAPNTFQSIKLFLIIGPQCLQSVTLFPVKLPMPFNQSNYSYYSKWRRRRRRRFPKNSPIWSGPETITPRNQISRLGGIPHFDQDAIFPPESLPVFALQTRFESIIWTVWCIAFCRKMVYGSYSPYLMQLELLYRSEGFPNRIFHPRTLWDGALARWKIVGAPASSSAASSGKLPNMRKCTLFQNGHVSKFRKC